MFGIILGAVVSMVFVTYLVKIGKFSKKMKGRPQGGSKGSPNSTAEDREFNEDKFV
jgi:hypothetical protein